MSSEKAHLERIDQVAAELRARVDAQSPFKGVVKTIV